MSMSLPELLRAWEEWAERVPRAVDGWESGFPRWEDLMSATVSTMKTGTMTSKMLDGIERCWAISEETEDLADFAKDNVTTSLPYLCFLAGSESPAVRWQVYEALSTAGKSGEPLLRRGLKDVDAYARRRAILSLATLRPSDARDLAEAYMQSDDPYIRLAAVSMVAVSDDVAFIEECKHRLLGDEIGFVRDAALDQL